MDEMEITQFTYFQQEASQISIHEAKNSDEAYYLELKVPTRVNTREGFWNFLEKFGFLYGYESTRPLLASEDYSISLLKKVLRQVEIIKNSRSGMLNFEYHEIKSVQYHLVVCNLHKQCENKEGKVKIKSPSMRTKL